MGYIGEGAFNVKADMNSLKASMKQVEAEVLKGMKDIENKVSQEQKGMWEKFSPSTGVLDVLKGAGLATGVYSVTRAVKNLGASAVNSFMQWEFAMTTVQAKAFATNEELEKMKELTLSLATTSLYSAIQQADALKILVEMGLSATEAMSALPKIINLATTEQMNLAHAADIAIGIIRGMGMSVDDLSKVNDVLAYTAAKSASSIFSIGQAMKVAASTGALSGQSLADLSSTIGGLSNRMIRSEAAGYAVTQMIARFTRAWQSSKSVVDETGSMLGKARMALKHLGVELMNNQKVLKPLPQLFKEFAAAGVTTGQALDLMGVYTYRNFIAAVKAADEIERLKNATEGWGNAASGATDKIAELQKDTLLGHVKQLINVFEVLGIRVGEDFKGSATIFIDTVKMVAESLNSLLILSKKSSKFLQEQGVPVSPAWQPWQLYSEAVNSAYTAVENFITKFNWTGFMVHEEGLWKKSAKQVDEYAYSLARIRSVFPILDALQHYNITDLPSGKNIGGTKTSTFVPPSEEEYERQVDKILQIKTKMYAAMKTMTIEHFKFERAIMLNLADTELLAREKLAETSFELKMAGLRKSGQSLDAFIKEENTYKLERDKEIIDAQNDYQVYTTIRTSEILKKFVDNRSKAGIEALNKEKQEAQTLAEAYNRLAAGMKESSSDYFIWKERALKEQYNKELLIVGKTEEGKFLIEKWYAEQLKQLHYQEVERLGTFTEGMQVSIDKLHDVGMEVGKAGEQFFNSMTGAGESALSEGFQSITSITDNWGEKMLDIFKSLSDNILKITSDLMAQLIVKWAIMKIFSATTGGIGSFNAGTGNFEGIGTSNTLFGSLGSSGTQVPMVAQTPFVSTNTMSSNRNMTRGNTFNQTIEMKIDATDANSFRKMLKRDGAEIQKIVGNGVKRNMGYASELRGRRE